MIELKAFITSDWEETSANYLVATCRSFKPRCEAVISVMKVILSKIYLKKFKAQKILLVHL